MSIRYHFKVKDRIQNQSTNAGALRKSTRAIFNSLSSSDKKKVKLIIVFQILLSTLDLIGVALVGFIASLSVSLFQDTPQNESANKILTFLGMSELSKETQIFTLSLLAAIALSGKSIISLLVTKRILAFFSNRCAELSISLMERLMSTSILQIRKKTVQESVYSVTRGSEFLMIQILGNLTVLISDFAVMAILVLTLIYFDPVLAIMMLIIFGGVVFVLNKLLFQKALVLGEINTNLNVQSNDLIANLIYAQREIMVGGRLGNYFEGLRRVRRKLGVVAGQVNFMPFIAKYVIEALIVIGALFMAYVKILISSPAEAISSLALFLAAGTRMGPSVLRIQNGLMHIRSSLGMAQPTLELMGDLEKIQPSKSSTGELHRTHPGFIPMVEIVNVSFRFPDTEDFLFNSFSLKINRGSYVALIGESGVGKSTLVDLLLGIVSPTQGEVRISGINPRDAIHQWPGAIGFVPQDIRIFNGTIAQNILMGYEESSVSNDDLMRILRMVGLADFVRSLPLGLQTEIEEGGSNLSGGQRQRIGIARALMTEPSLLILDEATSALDGESESTVLGYLENLDYEVTKIVVSHRLKSVSNADFIICLREEGQYEVGTYEELRSKSTIFMKSNEL